MVHCGCACSLSVSQDHLRGYGTVSVEALHVAHPYSACLPEFLPSEVPVWGKLTRFSNSTPRDSDTSDTCRLWTLEMVHPTWPRHFKFLSNTRLRQRVHRHDWHFHRHCGHGRTCAVRWNLTI